MKKLRILALALVVVMAMPLMAACSKDGAGSQGEENKPSNTGGNNKTPDKEVPVFVERDYSGEDFVFLTYDENQTDYVDNYIWNEEDHGDPVRKATIDRNRAVKEKYGIEIKKDMTNGPAGTAKQRMQAGACDFDVVYEWGIRHVKNAVDGLYLNVLEVPNIKFDNSYWAPSAQENLTVADKMMIFTNDITMNRIAWASFYAFNKQLLVDFKNELAAAGYSESPYDYVKNNTWTYDTFLGMALSVSSDVDGDQEYTKEDIYGFSGKPADLMKDILRNSGFDGVVKTDDGFNLDYLNPRVSDIYSRYSSMLATTNALAVDVDWIKGEDISGFASEFKARRFLSFGEGHLLFTGFNMDFTGEFVNMEDEYGVVPNPKYTETQSEYYHYIDGNAPMFAIPVQTEDTDRTGVVLEYMAYESEVNLLPAFYETTIQYKRMNSANDLEMLDIIRDSTHYRWHYLYSYALETVNDWDDNILSEMYSGGRFGSVYNRYKDKAIADIEEIYDKIDAVVFE